MLRPGIGTERCHGSADFAGGGSEDRVVATSRYFLENDAGACCLGELRTHSDRDDLVVATMNDKGATLPRDQLLKLSLVVEAMGDQKAERDAECDLGHFHGTGKWTEKKGPADSEFLSCEKCDGGSERVPPYDASITKFGERKVTPFREERFEGLEALNDGFWVGLALAVAVTWVVDEDESVFGKTRDLWEESEIESETGIAGGDEPDFLRRLSCGGQE